MGYFITYRQPPLKIEKSYSYTLKLWISKLGICMKYMGKLYKSQSFFFWGGKVYTKLFLKFKKSHVFVTFEATCQLCWNKVARFQHFLKYTYSVILHAKMFPSWKIKQISYITTPIRTTVSLLLINTFSSPCLILVLWVQQLDFYGRPYTIQRMQMSLMQCPLF